jgi:uncharacterized protein YutD
VSDEEGGQSHSTVSDIKAVSGTDVRFVGTIKAFNDLFVVAELGGFFVEVLESYDFVVGEGW